MRAGRIDGRTVPPCSVSLLGRSAWGALGAGFAFRVRSDSFESSVYGDATDHAFYYYLIMYQSSSLPDDRGFVRHRLRVQARPPPARRAVAPPISRRAGRWGVPTPLPFPHLCYDLGVPPRPPPLHERVHAAIGMLRVPPSPCESLPRQAYGYPLTVLHAAARAAHLTGSAEDARASSLSRHMRP